MGRAHGPAPGRGPAGDATPARSKDALDAYGFSDYQAWGDNWGAPLHGAQLDGTVGFETVDWLRHKPPLDQPWFLVSSMVDPHDVMFLRGGEDERAHANGALAPLTHPPQDLGFMRDYDVELPANFSDDLDGQPYGSTPTSAARNGTTDASPTDARTCGRYDAPTSSTACAWSTRSSARSSTSSIGRTCGATPSWCTPPTTAR